MSHRRLHAGSEKSSSIGLRWALCALLTALLAVSQSASGRKLESLSDFPMSTLQIRTHAGVSTIRIWVADTVPREEQGLMFVRSLAPDRGMLFPQQHPRVMQMWMKNTVIPLDMLFIDAQGHIVYIRQYATPESEAIISTPVPVKAVLELKGGECAKQGIRVGDIVVGRYFSSARR